MKREPSYNPRTRVFTGSALTNRGRSARRGISVLWLVVTMPIFLFLFVGVVMIGNIWLARVELENALEASALAAVKNWAEFPNYGGDTLSSRGVGKTYALANTMTGVPVEISTNYDQLNVTGSANQNLLCDPTKPGPLNVPPPGGNLIFGAVTITNPRTPSEYIEFDAGTSPGAGSGSVIFDASANGQPGGGGGTTNTDNWWGVSFRPTATTPANFTISRLVFDLRANGGSGSFGSIPALSDNVAPHMVSSGGTDQPDIFGFDAVPANQISFSILPATPWIMTITFNAFGGDPGFEPCDRMRFGVELDGVGPSTGGGSLKDDGDSVGHDGVRVAIYYADSGVERPAPVYATFLDTQHPSNQCVNQLDSSSPCTPFSMIVHPGLYPDVPCPPASAPKNNGQSLAFASGSGGNAFGVRAQAIVPVPNPFCGFCGLAIKPHYVTVKTTAMYDPAEGQPRLIRVDEYYCPGPKP